MAKETGGNITEAEWPIMCVLWNRGVCTSAEIIADVTRERGAANKRTLKALLNRLIAKQLVSFTRDATDSRVYHYRPAITRDAAVRIKNTSFLDMVYGGNPASLLTHFVMTASLSPDDIAGLHALLDEKEKDAR